MMRSSGEWRPWGAFRWQVIAKVLALAVFIFSFLFNTMTFSNILSQFFFLTFVFLENTDIIGMNPLYQMELCMS